MSLNEVEALAKKATRGAGYPWGLAEEAGKAVRWLCAANIDGCAALAELLVESDGVDLSDRKPCPGTPWTSSGKRLCPLLAGVTLSDLADTLADRDIQLENVAWPILLAPFAGLSARCLKKSVALEWEDACVATDGENVAISGNIKPASATVSVSVGVRFEPEETQSRCSRANPEDHAITVLNRFAHRTYAPATEASRLSGAGAGLSDTD